MDELDVLLETMDSSEPVEVESSGDLSNEVELALHEFTTSEKPADRLEALKLLIQLMK